MMPKSAQFAIQGRVVNTFAGAFLEKFSELLSGDTWLRVEYLDKNLSILGVQDGFSSGAIATRYVIVDALELTDDAVDCSERHAGHLAQLAHASLALAVQLDHPILLGVLLILLGLEAEQVVLGHSGLVGVRGGRGVVGVMRLVVTALAVFGGGRAPFQVLAEVPGCRVSRVVLRVVVVLIVVEVEVGGEAWRHVHGVAVVRTRGGLARVVRLRRRGLRGRERAREQAVVRDGR